jgi:hypothetical protein
MTSHPAVALALACFGPTLSCGNGAPDPARYPARSAGCAIRTYPAEAPVAVDDLGVVSSTCRAGENCERMLLDEACERGADVVWGFAENSLTATRLVAHAAHTARARQGARPRGCDVRVFADAPPMRTENVGPVTAFCAESDSREACLRELQDQVCTLGGDVLWQVEGPAQETSSNGPGQRMRGRAAHTR